MLGVLLAGIVATQVEVLKLGASMGRSINRTSTLTTENELLQASVASLGDSARIESLASGMGMVMPPPGAVDFLGARSARQAATNVQAPNPSAFLSYSTSNGAVVTGEDASTVTEAQGSASATAGVVPAVGESASGAPQATDAGAGATAAGQADQANSGG